MKNLLLIILMFLAMNGFAQTDNLKQTEQYFEFMAVKKGLFEKGYGYNISVNFGQRYLSNDSVNRTKTIERITTFSKIEDVLGYMNSIGWKLVTAYTTSHDHFYTFYYILKKEL